MTYPLRFAAGTLASGLMVLCASGNALARPSFKSALQSIRDCYSAQNYVDALKRVEETKHLAQHDQEHATAYAFEGMILATLAIEQRAAADKVFREVLSQHGDVELPMEGPNHVEQQFKTLRDSFPQKRASPAERPPEPCELPDSEDSPDPCAPSTPVDAQDNFGEALQKLRESFASSAYDEALSQLKHARDQARNSEQKRTVSLSYGMILAASAHQQETKATGAFSKALVLYPKIQLPPVPNPNSQVKGLFTRTQTTTQRELARLSTLPREEKARWKTTASMARARQWHTATLLRSGKVLITGGVNADGSLAEAELYDPSTDTWSPTDSMSTRRYRHTATLLPSDKVLVAGGENDEEGALATAELYDPATGTWTPTGAMNTGRRYHTATLLAGKVLITGGEDSASDRTASTELYDPETGLWTVTGDLSHARIHHEATLLSSGKVLVTGGVGAQDTLSNSEVYDPKSGAWTVSPGVMPGAFSEHQASLLPSGKVLVTGGYDNETVLDRTALYDPATDTWLSEANSARMPLGRTGHSATKLSTGKVLICGGEGTSEALSGKALVYEPITGTWMPTASMATARIGNTATLLGSGQVLIAGGSHEDLTLSSAELYVP
jgi:N-acetylneuraminic acid mutarotase